MAKNSHFYHAAVIFLTCCIFLQACADDLHCISGTYAKYVTMLRSHVFFLCIVSCGVTRFHQVWKMAKNSHSYHAVVIFLTCCVSLQACADDLQCIHGTYAEYGTMLRGHVFQEHNAANILACSLLCNSNIRCQSINYVISRHLCELNSRTKVARPDDYVQDADRVYVTRPSERGIELTLNNGAVQKD